MSMPSSHLITKDISQRLATLNFVCTLLIVFVHCNRVPGAWFSGGDGMSLVEAFAQFGFCAGVARIALPTFLLISGFLMVKDYDVTWSWWRRILTRRIVSLYIPFVLWNIVAWLWAWVHSSPNAIISILPISEKILGWNLFVPPACVQLWYFRAVLIYALIVPLACLLLRHFKVGLLTVFLLWAAGLGRVPSCCMELAWENTSYFFAGVWLSLHADEIIALWHRHEKVLTWLLPLSYGFFWLVMMAGGFSHFRQLYNRSFYLLIPAGCATLWLVTPWLVRVVSPLKPLFGYSLTVFALHLMALGKMEQLFKWMGTTNRLAPWAILGEAFLAIAICMLIGWMLQHTVPKFFVILNGGRSKR